MLSTISPLLFIMVGCVLIVQEVQGQCSPTCKNGGTCSGTTCQCADRFLGSSCETFTNFVEAQLAALPSLKAYWPLSSTYTSKDAKAYYTGGIHGYAPISSVTFNNNGPLGVAKTAALFSKSSVKYLAVDHGSKLTFGASFTMLAYVYTPTGSQNFFFYVNPIVNVIGLKLTMANDNVLSAVQNNDFALNTVCNMVNTWQYIGVQFDSSTKTLRTFCGSSFTTYSINLPSSPNTSLSHVYIGNNSDVTMACLSFHDGALTATEIGTVKTACKYFSVSCSSCPAGQVCRGKDTCDYPICNPQCMNGKCSTDWTGTCTCDAGWNGAFCDSPICASACQNSGACTAPNTCTCTSRWNGTTCTVPVCSPPCLNSGTCTSPDMCACTASWTGPTCQTPICASPCQNGGNCTAPNTCTCPTSLYTGATCTVPVCSPTCVQGSCIAPNNCSCNVGWTGTSCDTAICSSPCQNGGTCTGPDLCTCPVGWAGATCQTPICTLPCQNGGTCSAPDTCNCTASYSGSTCTSPVCNPACSHGSCSAPNVCTCTGGWNGATCSNAICVPSCTNPRNNCSSPNTCSCPAGRTGMTCTTPVCSSGCLNGGTCVAPENCTCRTGWTGSNCQSAICSTQCYNGGSCTAPDNCTCATGWTGADCTSAICTTPCKNNGTCSSPDACSCVAPFGGILCDDVSTTASISSLNKLTSAQLEQYMTSVCNAIKTTSYETITNILSRGDQAAADLDTFAKLASSVPSSKFLEYGKAVAQAGSDIMMAAVMPYEGDGQLNLGDGSKRCQVGVDGTADLVVTRPNGFATLARDRLKTLHSNFYTLAESIAKNARAALTLGSTFFYSSDFYEVYIGAIRLGDLPKYRFETTYASVNFSDAQDALAMFSSFDSCSGTVRTNTTIYISLSTFRVNVKNFEQPLNMPTLSLKIFCSSTAEMSLSSNYPVNVTLKPSHYKALMLTNVKNNAQCVIPRNCNMANATLQGTLLTFPISLSAGDFVLSFPFESLSYVATLRFNEKPSETDYTWLLSVDRYSYALTARNPELTVPEIYYDLDSELRMFLPASAISSLNLDSQTVPKLYVFVKRDFSGASSTLAACEVQRVNGYHLQVAALSQTSRKRRDSTAVKPDYYIFPQSSESSVIFQTSKLGEIGSNLLISASTAEQADPYVEPRIHADIMPLWAFIAGLGAFWLIGLIFAFVLDRRDLNYWAYQPATRKTSDQCDHLYITFFCGHPDNEHTDPSLSIRFWNDKEESDWQPLKGGFIGIRSAERFIIERPPKFERLDAIELKFEQAKRGSGRFAIFIRRIVVLDVQEETKHYYLVNKVVMCDGSSVTIDLASEDEVTEFGMLAPHHLRRAFVNVHQVVSLFTRPEPSRYTRIERLTTLVATLFLSLLANLLIYWQIGSFIDIGYISVYTIGIGIGSSILASSVTFLLSMFFRLARRQSAENQRLITNLNLPAWQKGQTGPPWGLAVVGWLLMIGTIAISIYMVISFGQTLMSKERSLTLLTGFAVGLSCDWFGFQILLCLLIGLIRTVAGSVMDDGPGTVIYRDGAAAVSEPKKPRRSRTLSTIASSRRRVSPERRQASQATAITPVQISVMEREASTFSFGMMMENTDLSSRVKSSTAYSAVKGRQESLDPYGTWNDSEFTKS